MKKCIIYLRTSTEEQNPELQLKDCLSIATKLNISDYEVLEEQKSAYKDNVEREVFNSLKKAIQKGEVKILIVWDLDRLFRNRIKCVDFIRNYAKIGLKVYSFRQSWFEDIEKIPSPFNEIMFDLMLQVVGWIAEEESNKKSERVKNAVRKENGITKSYKGNKWGRKALKIDESIVNLYKQGKSMRDICKEIYYWDKNNHKKFVSLGYVQGVIKCSEIPTQKELNENIAGVITIN